MESSKGADWYLRQPVAGKFAVPSSLNLSAIANTITGAFSCRKLVRKGVPPALRPQVWLSVSGAVKKRSTVLESNYEDLTTAVDGQIIPATRQIDYDLPRTSQVALAIFKVCEMKEDQLLVTHQIGEVINILPATNPNQLMTVAFDKTGPIPTNAIQKQRRGQKSIVTKELDYQLQRLKFLKYTE